MPSAKSTPLLQARALTRKYGEHAVIDKLDLRVRQGTAVALVGANGSGKSTTLRCIAGVDTATSGEVLFDGEVLDPRSHLVRRDIAIVLDDIDFFPDLSVVEHLDLLARAHGVEGAEEVVDDVLNDIGLINQSAQLPNTLSSGQRRRLCLASAFVRPYRLLIADEPEQRLDTAGLDWLAERFNQDKAQGRSIVLASHSKPLLEAIGALSVSLDAPA